MAEHAPLLGFLDSSDRVYQPLDAVRVFVRAAGTLCVFDGENRPYALFRAVAGDIVEFTAGGRLGTHRVELSDGEGQPLDTASFTLDAATSLRDDTGRYAELFALLRRTMCCYAPNGFESYRWHGKDYPCFLPWILDHSHTAKGMQYFNDGARGLVELFAENQREDGLIWSWVFRRQTSDHFLSAYGPDDYAREIGDGLLLGRQPVENHPEYNFVDAMHTTWKSSGDREWLARHVDHAVRALDYALSKPYRYSPKFQLLVRAFTIDSWDFQSTDSYYVNLGIGGNQRIDPKRTKFGVFFGDNHGYADACDKLAEMLRALGRDAEADAFVARGAGIRERLDALVWNGRFFRQRQEEDPTVKRDFGVDIDEQSVMSNLYALNRGIRQDQKDAIIAWYEDLRDHLPRESPGEWYAIYPPFEKPFSEDCGKWDYMNAGVHIHAAGELVRGAYKCGHEAYATDVLQRILAIGKRTQGDILKFAYTGAHEPPPPPPAYTPVDISSAANMDILVGAPDSEGVDWMLSHMPFDMVNLPSGDLTVKGAPYRVLDRKSTRGRVAAAIGRSPKLPDSMEIPVHAKAAALRLAHCTADHKEDPMAALLVFRYTDGTEEETGIYKDRHIANWWYVETKETPTGGIFWKGPDTGAVGMGLVWTEIRNPHPEREIASLVFRRVFDGSIYSLVALTLASAPVYVPKTFESFGGPDNWSGGLVMAGLEEGLVGAENAPDSAAYERVVLSPRWAATDVSEVSATTRLAASSGYVSYTLKLDRAAHEIRGTVTTSAVKTTLRMLLPADAGDAMPSLEVDGAAVPCSVETVRESRYAVASLPDCPGPMTFVLRW